LDTITIARTPTTMATTQKTVLITGCSKDSLGEALAIEFQRRGFLVIATARSRSRLSKLTELGIDTRKVDLQSTESIKAFAAGVKKLDILFNNAGANLVMPLADTTPAEFRSMFEINVFSHFELTQCLLPKMIESKGIIVNHTSQSCYGVKAPAGAYASAKAALACMTDVLRVELKPFGVRVVEVVTGMAASNITKFEKTPKVPEGSIYEPIRTELERTLKSEEAGPYATKSDVWAKRVVSDLLDVKWWSPWSWTGQPPVWIWRGFMASVMYWIWRVDTTWKGSLDGLLGMPISSGVLKNRLKEQEAQKKDI
jgi:1-acylglycerone phosphate reductase